TAREPSGTRDTPALGHGRLRARDRARRGRLAAFGQPDPDRERLAAPRRDLPQHVEARGRALAELEAAGAHLVGAARPGGEAERRGERGGAPHLPPAAVGPAAPASTGDSMRTS